MQRPNMKKLPSFITRPVALAAALTALAACGAGDIDDMAAEGEPVLSENLEGFESIDGVESLGELEQPLMNCNNVDGANSVMAALAVATAQELRRWQPSKDFVVFGTSGRSESSAGPQQAIKLTATGKAQCSDRTCFNVQALLDMQYDQANDKVKINNITLNPAALRSRLVAKLREQQTCEQRPANGSNSNCPVEEHKLTFQRAEKGGCDTNFFFKATQPNGQALKFPAQLKNKLLWVDSRNPYIGFQNVGDIVAIDPTFGLNQANATTTGSCYAACTRVSSSSVAGACCSCGGKNKKFVKAAWSGTTYLCQ
jgi:hypothetical protein